jgi:hypothetical protein
MNRHFIEIDDRSLVVDGFSDEDRQPIDSSIEVNVGMNPGRVFCIILNLTKNEVEPEGSIVVENNGKRLAIITSPQFKNEDGVLLYKYDKIIKKRTKKDITNDTIIVEPEVIVEPPTLEERIAACEKAILELAMEV